MNSPARPAASGPRPTSSTTAADGTASEFARRMNGYLHGMLRWPELDALWARVRADPQGWYAYQVGEALPSAPLDADALICFVDELDALLRREHQADYCGVAYADDPERPTLIKVYDPHHMGSFCGGGGPPIPPRWLLSRHRPEPIEDLAPVPMARRSWWRRVFGGSAEAAG